MGIFFNQGENKSRAGVYQRYDNNSAAGYASAQDGIVAAVFSSNWGPLNQVQIIDREQQIDLLFGGGNTKIMRQAINGGASVIKAVRAGTGGTKGNCKLKDSTEGALDAITITLKYEGNRALHYAVRENLSDSGYREFVIIENGTILESLTFSASDSGEVDALIEASANSAYVDMTKMASYSGTGKLVLVADAEFIAGNNPTVTNQSYSDALAVLESHKWNVAIVDTNDTSVHAILSGFVNRMYALGKMGFCVMGEPSTVEFATRCDHARAYNDYNTVYIGSGYLDSKGQKVEGFEIAAYLGGLIASIPSNRSITHSTISGAVNLVEYLTNSQYEKAVQSGMIALSLSSNGQVWIESGITTLVNPANNDDAGWKKIKRCKVRFELMSRISDSVDPLIGQINNNADGKAQIVVIGQGVLNTMIQEGKLLEGASIAYVEDASADADSAYFEIVADDVDSMEKVYLVYKFRFNTAA